MERISKSFTSTGLLSSDLFTAKKEVEYYIDRIVQKEGRSLITGSSGFANFLLSLNLAIALTSSEEKFVETFNIKKSRVLYLELEKGDYEFSQCLKFILKDKKPENLFFKCLPGIDLCEETQLKWLEDEIKGLKIDVLFLTPLEFCFFGTKTNGFNVSALRNYFDELIAKHKVSIVLTSNDPSYHLTRDSRFLVWFDGHVFLRQDWLDCLRCVNDEKFKFIRLNIKKEDNYIFSLRREEAKPTK